MMIRLTYRASLINSLKKVCNSDGFYPYKSTELLEIRRHLVNPAAPH